MGDATVRILVIDDNPDLRVTLQWLLEAEGYLVLVAANGLEGLRLQRVHPSDLVVTDVFMPEQDGIETLWKFRQEFPDVPIVVMSGGGTVASGTDYLSVARHLGAEGTLAKPFDPKKLIDVVRR